MPDDQLVKNGRFAHSGIYEYSREELPRLGLSDPPPEIGDKRMYSIYRPGPVLIDAVQKGLFQRMTITREHPGEWVDPQNWKEHAVGMTGDTVRIEVVKDDNGKPEISIDGTLTLADRIALESYNRGVTELSPGYSASFQWRQGSHNGKPYDAIMTEVTETNHLALVDSGRGGKLSAITDAAAKLQDRAKKIASGLWWSVKRRTLVKDGKAGDEVPASEATGFRSSLYSLQRERASISDAEIENRLDQLRTLLVDLPYGDEKSILMSFMDDLRLMKSMEDSAVETAVNVVCALFDKLDKQAVGQAMSAFGDSGGKEMNLDLHNLIFGKPKDAAPEKPADMCDACGGTGKTKDGKSCDMCDGTGKRKVADKTPEEHANIPGAEKIQIPAKGSPQIPTTPTDAPPGQPAGAAPQPSGASTKVEPAASAKVPTNALDGTKVKDEPDPTQPAAVPGSQALSPSPEGTPAQPVGSGPSPAQPPAAAAPGGAPAAQPQLSPAEVLAQDIAAAIKKWQDATKGADAQPAPAQPVAQPAPAAAPAAQSSGAAAPEKKDEVPPEKKDGDGKPGDSAHPSEPAPSLTVLLTPGKAADAKPQKGGLAALVEPTYAGGRR